MICILPPEHPLQYQTTIAYDQINAQDFIMPKWGNNGDVRRILIENSLKPKIRNEVMEDQAIIAMVQNGPAPDRAPRTGCEHGKTAVPHNRRCA